MVAGVAGQGGIAAPSEALPGQRQWRAAAVQKQFPLAPGFATTAHAAQGQTCKEGVVMDMHIGEAGDPLTAYIALTRVQDRHGLFVYRPFLAAPFQKGAKVENRTAGKRRKQSRRPQNGSLERPSKQMAGACSCESCLGKACGQAPAFGGGQTAALNALKNRWLGPVAAKVALARACGSIWGRGKRQP